MISRRTIFALLLALLAGGGMYAWTMEHPDDCARYLKGDTTVPSSVYVDQGRRQLIVPCRYWLPRQTLWMQTLVIVEGALLVVFVMSVWLDVVKARQRRMEMMRQW